MVSHVNGRSLLSDQTLRCFRCEMIDDSLVDGGVRGVRGGSIATVGGAVYKDEDEKLVV